MLCYEEVLFKWVLLPKERAPHSQQQPVSSSLFHEHQPWASARPWNRELQAGAGGWLGPLRGAHTLVGTLGSRKNSDESSLVYQESRHRRKRDEGKGLESQQERVKGRRGRIPQRQPSMSVQKPRGWQGTLRVQGAEHRVLRARQGWKTGLEVGSCQTGGGPKGLVMGPGFLFQATR